MRECAACGAHKPRPHYGGLTRCDECGHVWADVEIDDRRLREIYDRNYFFGEEYTNYLDDLPMARRNFAARLRELEPFLGPAHQRLFEIGCAYGIFLDLSRTRFREVSGIDISEDAVTYARERLGLDVRCGDLLDAGLGASRYDVVCLWDTIEHLRQPDRYLEHIAGHMPSGGLLALTTGDIGSLNARMKRERWRLIHPPTHLHYFSRGSLQRLLSRFGFDVASSRHCGISRSLGSIADGVLRLRWGWDRAAGMVRALPIRSIPVYLNLFDVIYVIARKR